MGMQEETDEFHAYGSKITLRGVRDVTSFCKAILAKELHGPIWLVGIAQLVQLAMPSETTPTDRIPASVRQVIK